MAAVAQQKPRRWTYEEYSRSDDQRYEIIDRGIVEDAAKVAGLARFGRGLG